MKRIFKNQHNLLKKVDKNYSTKPNVTIFGNGFVSRNLVEKLNTQFNQITVACRFPNEVTKKYENVKGEYSDITNNESVYHAISGSEVVINTTNINYESEYSWRDVFVDGVQHISFNSKNLNVKQLIQFSCLGSKLESKSLYSDMKYRSEDMSYGCYPEVNIIKSSLIFGHQNKLLDGLYKAGRFLPFYPLPGGNSKLQPIHMDDVANGVLEIIKKDLKGKTFEFAGPKVLSFSETIQKIYKFKKSSGKMVVSLPIVFGDLFVGVSQFLPSPTFSREMVAMLEENLLPSENSLKIQDLGIEPKEV
eukprot:gene4423-7798_t